MRNKSLLMLFTLAAFTAVSLGCSARYGCPAPDGVTCQSMTDVYHGAGSPGKEAKKDTQDDYPFRPEVLSGSVPVRKAPKVIRIWIAPWVDEDEDLHQPGYIYAELPVKKWAIGEYPVEIRQNSGPPLPPPVSQQKALTDLEKERESLEKAKQPLAAPEGTPFLPGLLK